MIEAELKARVSDPQSVRALLLAAAGEPEVAQYEDTYFDRAGELAADGRELRLRTIATSGDAWTLLTYKGPVLDTASGSKTESETRIDDRAAMATALAGLGYAPTIAFTKHCENYSLTTLTGRAVLATLVTVPELEGTFLEVEAMADEEQDMHVALDELRTVLLDLEISPDALTTELYTEAVAVSRERSR